MSDTANDAPVGADDERQEPEFAFHGATVEAALARLASSPRTGLTSAEAERRLAEHGANKMDVERGGRVFRLIAAQFSSIVVWLLAIAAVIAFFTGGTLEAIAILTVLMINAAIGFVIEWQSGRALDALKKATKTIARVRRDGSEKIVDAETLVAGDIVVLTAGDRVPADSRLIEAVNLRTDESTLTGESEPADKNAAAVAVATPLAERASMVYLGTTVVAGRAVALVAGTAGDSEMGRIGRLVASSAERKTPLENKLAKLGQTLVYVVLGIAAVVFLAGYLRGDGLWLMLEVSVSLAVAAVPEGLPAVTTLVLALGVWRMAKNRAIVRKLSAVETLGATTVVCTDKTGTLTENEMTVREFRLANDAVAEFTDYERGGGRPPADASLKRVLDAGVLCNDSELSTGAARHLGDPTEIALLQAAKDAGVDTVAERHSRTRVFERPFDSATKMMTCVWRTNGEHATAFMKGAPAVVLGVCDRYLASDGAVVALTDSKRTEFLARNEQMAERALRVLAFADKDLDVDDGRLPDYESATRTGFVFLGFAGLIDPPREGANEAVRKAREAGIRVVMLTGDQLNTARAVAADLELAGGEELIAVHADRLAALGDDELAAIARRAHVFARVSPEDKLRIVGALQKAGEIVAVTGDGVNDAPALKRADIGVAMGGRGTEVAKESADLVLTDDNFSTIVGAIEGGRTIYSNIVKLVNLLFSDNISEVLVIFAAIVAGLPLPFSPLQILWINLVTDVFPALALAVEPAPPGEMQRPPRPPSAPILSRGLIALIFAKGVFYAALALATYVWALGVYGEGAHSRTIVFLAIVAVQVANLFNCRSVTRSAIDGVLGSPFVFAAAGTGILLQLLAVYFTPLATVLGTVRPTSLDWTVIGLCLVVAVAVVEAGKLAARRRADYAAGRD